MSMEHEGSGMTWSREEVKTLLDIWGEDECSWKWRGQCSDVHTSTRDTYTSANRAQVERQQLRARLCMNTHMYSNPEATAA